MDNKTEQTRKDELLASLYYDFALMGSQKELLTEAIKKDKTITVSDVKNWFDRNIVKTGNLKGYNSFIPDGPYIEYQIDLFFFDDKTENQKFKIALVMIDAFDRYATAVPIKSKQPPDVLAGLMEGINNMHGKPRVIYSDNEGSFSSKIFIEYLKDEKIDHVISLNKAAIAERFIRTLKNMLNKRLELKDNTQKWYEMLGKVLLVYNNFKIHSTIRMTPKEGRKKENLDTVKMNLEKFRHNTRIYPEIKIGDKVRVYKKRQKAFDKEAPKWSKNTYEVLDIVDNKIQKLYKIAGKANLITRAEILLIPQ